MAKRKRVIKTQFRVLENRGRDEEFLKLAENLIDEIMPDWDFKMDVEPHKHYFLGVSGGADSSVLALVLAVKNPSLPFEAIFSDSGNEPEDVYEILDILSSRLNMKVTVAKPEKSLFEMIATNGYLPSARQRWCTAMIKIRTFEDYLSGALENPETICVNAAGLRYDERDRKGLLGIDRVESVHPFIDQKITREQVMRLGAELGVLSVAYFRGKSRSGCLNCFFQSRQELISLATWDRKHFELGKSVEKLSQNIIETYDDSEHPLQPSLFYSRFPLPKLITEGKESFTVHDLLGGNSRFDDFGVNWDYVGNSLVKKKKKVVKPVCDDQLSIFDLTKLSESSKCENDEAKPDVEPALNVNELLSLFGDSVKPKFWERTESVPDEFVDIYVAVEVLISPYSMGHGFNNYGGYSHKVITYSTSQGGLSRAVKGYFYHRQCVADAYFSGVDGYDATSHVVCIQMRFPKRLLPDVNYDEEGVYTWSQGVSYLEIDFTLRAITRLGEYLYLKQLIEYSDKHGYRTMEVKQARKDVQRIEDLDVELGELIAIGHFRTNFNNEELREDSYDEDARTVRCIACSL
ncbi:phosphoadenosine phosphosulfate reductase family protein [Vibrio sp. SCSIO 43155]|uniref:phosphoadenosine phosphosulfate reductase domain-containing protein n=1 Tax=Vibrio sp. SCSIO 43155 TaxID=2819099 RepID=UPI0020750524|nr:phosphoadenosine phosphosulfate reductase family protein [Vibrio sp. SCSIO 43155]USD58568.1 phosphoadenosine phosphosulfate reductase family protein [Vibrio sp. SCSIO 43155]